MKLINTSHLLGIDALRFVAAIMVVWFHFGYLMGTVPDGTAATASRHLLVFPELYDWSFFGWVGVEVFFVISGFVIAFSGEKASPFSFFASRVIRLVPGVWICSLITLATVLLLGDAEHVVLFRQFRHSMLFLTWGSWIDGSFWTLGIEISFYCCVLAVIALKRFDWIVPLAIVIGTVSAAYEVLLALAAANRVPAAWSAFLLLHGRTLDLFLLHHGVYFALGVFLWRHLVKQQSTTNLVWLALFGAAGLLEVARQASEVDVPAAVQPTLLVSTIWLAGMAAVVASVRFNAFVHRAPGFFLRGLKTAGMMTFPLYLVHTVAGATVMGRLVMLGCSRWTALGLGMLVVLVTAYGVACYAEPALQQLFHRLPHFVPFLHRDKARRAPGWPISALISSE